MRKEILYSLRSPYREQLDIIGYKFGSGKKLAAIVGALRGNEIQQMYVCSRMIAELKTLEEKHCITDGIEIMVVPCVNCYSMNIGKRFWAMDNTDINRMFPGYDQGETTQRIADGIFRNLQGYEYGMQLASFYQQGNFLPHVKMMDTGFTDPKLMKNFGLQFGIIRVPRPYDTTTLNYNWQVWETKAFSVYTNSTDTIDEESADEAVCAMLRFLGSVGALIVNVRPGYNTLIVHEANTFNVQSESAGLYIGAVKIGKTVAVGDLLGKVTDPFEGTVKAEVRSPVPGIVYFEYKSPLINEKTVCCKIIR